MWDLSGPGMEAVFPAAAGGFFTTEPPGKTQAALFFKRKKKKFFIDKGKILYFLFKKEGKVIFIHMIIPVGIFFCFFEF